MIGASLVASLLLVTLVLGLLPNVGYAQRPPLGSSAGAGSELITISGPIEEHRQQITVIDTAKRVMSVYHINTSSGEISLKSVRTIFWDLQMVEFNGTSPLPREIRSLLEQK